MSEITIKPRKKKDKVGKMRESSGDVDVRKRSSSSPSFMKKMKRMTKQLSS